MEVIGVTDWDEGLTSQSARAEESTGYVGQVTARGLSPGSRYLASMLVSIDGTCYRSDDFYFTTAQ